VSNPRVIYALPTGSSMNPQAPQDSAFFDAQQTCYVLQKVSEARTRPTRVLTSFAGITSVGIGSRFMLRHDQHFTGLGEYEVVGIAEFFSGVRFGDVPNRKIMHCVAK